MSQAELEHQNVLESEAGEARRTPRAMLLRANGSLGDTVQGWSLGKVIGSQLLDRWPGVARSSAQAYGVLSGAKASLCVFLEDCSSCPSTPWGSPQRDGGPCFYGGQEQRGVLAVGMWQGRLSRSVPLGSGQPGGPQDFLSKGRGVSPDHSGCGGMEGGQGRPTEARKKAASSGIY